MRLIWRIWSNNAVLRSPFSWRLRRKVDLLLHKCSRFQPLIIHHVVQRWIFSVCWSASSITRRRNKSFTVDKINHTTFESRVKYMLFLSIAFVTNLPVLSIDGNVNLLPTLVAFMARGRISELFVPAECTDTRSFLHIMRYRVTCFVASPNFTNVYFKPHIVFAFLK